MGIRQSTGTARSLYAHNTLVDNTDWSPTPYLCQLEGQRLWFHANLCGFNRGDVSAITAPSLASFEGNLIFASGSTNPFGPSNLFTEPRLAPDRIHLLADSPARDAVVSPGPEGFQTDFDGDGAWLGTAPDIGADEFMPDHPMAATVAKAIVKTNPQPATLSGVFQDFEDTCPDCHTRTFIEHEGDFGLQLDPQDLCPDIVCSGQLHPVNYPFDFGTVTPGVHRLNVMASSVPLRTMSLWSRSPVSGHVAIQGGGSGPTVTQFPHPGVPVRLQGSTNLMAWDDVAASDVPAFIGARTNENWFFQTIVR